MWLLRWSVWRYRKSFPCASGSVDLGFGGLDELGGLDPYIKERHGLDEVLKDFDPMGPLGW